MPENLRRSLDQLAFSQIKHKAGGGKSLDSFKCVLQHLLLSIPIHCYVIQVDNYGKGRSSGPLCRTLSTTNWKCTGAYVSPIGILNHRNLPQ